MAFADLWSLGHFLWIFFGLLVAVGGISLVYIKKPQKHWVWMHKLFAFSGLALTFVGLSVIISSPQASPLHFYFGVAASVLALLTVFMAVLFTFAKRKGLRTTHIWLGRIVGVLWLLALIFALILYL